MSAHTPTPWHTYKTDTYTILEIEGEEIGIIDLEKNAKGE